MKKKNPQKKYDFFIDLNNQESTFGLASQFITEGSTVLDIGCSSGNFIKALKDIKKCRVIGIDIDESALSDAKKKGLEVYNFDVTKENFAKKLGTKQFDYILLLDILEHLDFPPSNLIENLKKLLAENGKIIITLPNFQHIDTVSRIIHQSFKYQNTGILDETHKHFYSPLELISIFWDENFKCQGIKRIILDAGKTELALDKLQYKKITSKLKELYSSPEAEVYQYLFVFDKNQDKDSQSLEQHLRSLNILPEEKTPGIDNDKWNIITRTQGTRMESLKEALYSIAIQEYEPKSVILVLQTEDNAVEKVEKLKNLIKNFKGILEIKLLQADPAKKRGHPLNVALDNRDGRFISFLDDDDVYYPQFSNLLMKEVRKENCNFAFGDCILAYQPQHGDHYKTTEKRKGFGADFNPVKMLTNNGIPINMYVVDFEDFRGCRFDENLDLTEDWDFLLGLMQTKIFRANYIPVKLSEYRIRNDQSNSDLADYGLKNIVPKSLINSRMYIANKYRGKEFKILFEDGYKVYPDINKMFPDSAIISDVELEVQKVAEHKDALLSKQEKDLLEYDQNIRYRDKLIADLQKELLEYDRNLKICIKQRDENSENLRIRTEERDTIKNILENLYKKFIVRFLRRFNLL